MKGLCWNVRGFNNPLAPTIAKTRALLSSIYFDFVFLAEIKCKVALVDPMFRSFGFSRSFGVDADETKGGLWFGFRHDANFECLLACQNFIVIKVTQCSGRFWYLCLVYGEPVTHKREAVWNDLSEWIRSFDNPFLLIGDFNQVDYQEDKWGGSKGRIPGATLFNKWKTEHLLMDIPFKGPRFTWCNKRDDHSVVLERLDKGYGSWDWNDIFPNSGITHLPIQVSDHAPIIFETELITCNGRRPYRMEAWNLDYEECIRLVHNEWTEPVLGSATVRMIRKLSRARNCMRLWSISKRKEWNKKWSDFDDNLVEGLHEIETKGVTRTFTTAYASQVEYAKVSAKYWKQRAKMKWNTEGDTCSKYFFNWVKGRAGRNYIAGIKMDNGEWNFDSEGIQGLFVQFYSRLFQEGANQINFEEYRLTVKNLFSINKEFLSPDDRDALGIRFTPKEILTAVFQLGPLKSPGPDGIPAIFFHKCWHFIKHDVVGTVLAILNGNSSLQFRIRLS
ncbi:uncharacterized protein LOC141640820 [Silene latifolia]|uniref:uncharacterized protein LOC141640820 n=1 Tax=Silene latifolia TaxID=37657 RepID=UPI003D772622